MFSPKQKIGHEVEEMVQAYLIDSGLKAVTTNYFCQGGEIDLIMRDTDVLVFVEVRYRQNEDYGGAVASITKRKQLKIVKAAKVYLQEKNLWDKVFCRFDVVVVRDNNGERTMHWLKDAFWVSGW